MGRRENLGTRLQVGFSITQSLVCLYHWSGSKRGVLQAYTPLLEKGRGPPEYTTQQVENYNQTKASLLKWVYLFWISSFFLAHLLTPPQRRILGLIFAGYGVCAACLSEPSTTHFLHWMKNTLLFCLFICGTNILVCLLTTNMKNCLTPNYLKMCDPSLVTLLKMWPHYSQSRSENATLSSGTSLLASYKEVPPTGIFPCQHSHILTCKQTSFPALAHFGLTAWLESLISVVCSTSVKFLLISSICCQVLSFSWIMSNKRYIIG